MLSERELHDNCGCSARASNLLCYVLMDSVPLLQFLRLVKTPNDPKACQRALLLSKSSTLQRPTLPFVLRKAADLGSSR